ncbi:hypothetical protein [Breoghania sp.]|uniref:hypothetical protein n=1 Tax=Breoghania sp. TaxID=2065378 RepID=UPI002AA7B7ED|nr:hypothetical protein [Breoghania sp.]
MRIASWNAMAIAVLLGGGLFGITHAAPSETEILRQMQETGDTEIRLDLLHKLGRYHSQAVRRALEEIAGNKDESTAARMQAVCSLSGSATRETVPLLMRIVEKDLIERHGYWACAIPLLGSLGDRQAIPLLIRVANQQEDFLAGMDHMAISAVAELADARELSFLMARAYIAPVRPDVMKALSRIASPGLVEVLVGGLQAGEEPETIKAAGEGLLRIGVAATPELNIALKNAASDEERQRIRMLLEQLR